MHTRKTGETRDFVSPRADIADLVQGRQQTAGGLKCADPAE